MSISPGGTNFPTSSTGGMYLRIFLSLFFASLSTKSMIGYGKFICTSALRARYSNTSLCLLNAPRSPLPLWVGTTTILHTQPLAWRNRKQPPPRCAISPRGVDFSNKKRSPLRGKTSVVYVFPTTVSVPTICNCVVETLRAYTWVIQSFHIRFYIGLFPAPRPSQGCVSQDG